MIVVMLALLSIARMQKRDLAVIHFSGPDDLRFDLFPKGEVTPAEVIALRQLLLQWRDGLRAVDGKGAGSGCCEPGFDQDASSSRS